MNPDWKSYESIYYMEGGYLSRTGHDPLFVLIVMKARHLLGGDGAETFRLCLFIIFSFTAANAAYRMPTNSYSIVTTALIVIAAFFSKSAIQIREGLAYVFVVFSLFPIFHSRGERWLGAGIAALIAVFIHGGTVWFGLMWLAALGLTIGPNWILATARPRIVLFTLAIVLGATGALYALRHEQMIEFFLEDMNNSLAEDPRGGIWKLIYWIIRGIFVIIVRKRLILAGRAGGKFGLAFTTILGSFAIPMIYTFCLILTVTEFYFTAFTAMVLRLFYTLTSTAILIIGLRGRANFSICIVALVSVADQLRVFESNP